MKNIIYIILFVYAVIVALTIVFFTGTGDAGDSICHYLYARYAVAHPELFFNHWAKPVYVFLACPFAQMGFVGIKIFNALVSLISIFLSYKIAQELHVKNAIMAAVIMICAPLYYILTFSGLTEPLFGCFIAVGIYFAIKQKYVISCLIISFLPFVRSEGLILIGVFGIFYLVKKQWKIVPLLLFGSLVYSVAGYFVHHDFLWIFNRIPYAKLSSHYGEGNLFHFVLQLIYVVGVPIYILFWVGLLSLIRRIIKKQLFWEEHTLIFLGFVCFFVAHSLFWYFGIFNSMGLIRVLVGVMPLIALIALQGFNFITEDMLRRKKTLRMILQGLLGAYIVIFPFTSNPAAINWKKDMMLTKDQYGAIDAANFVLKNKGTHARIVCAHPYVSVVLGIDYFDKNVHLELKQNNKSQIKTGDIIIWENWFAFVESNFKKEEMDNDTSLVPLYTSKIDDNGREIIYSIYEKRNLPAKIK